MPRYAALLRGINVGRGNPVAMSDLRALLAGLGHSDVRTHLRSGNAVFSSPEADPDAVAAGIERALEARLGRRIACLVRTREEMERVVAANPLRGMADNGSRLMALFLSRAPDPARLAEHDPRALDPGRIAIG